MDFNNTPTLETELSKKIAEKLTDQFRRGDFDETKDEFEEELQTAIKTKLETQLQTQNAPEADFQQELQTAIKTKLETELQTQNALEADFKEELQTAIKTKLETQLQTQNAPEANKINSAFVTQLSAQITPPAETIKPKFLRALAKLLKDRIAKPDFNDSLREGIKNELVAKLSIQVPSWVKTIFDNLKNGVDTMPTLKIEFPELPDVDLTRLSKFMKEVYEKDRGIMTALNTNRGIMTALKTDRGIMTALKKDRGIMTALKTDRGIMTALKTDQGVLTFLREDKGIAKWFNDTFSKFMESVSNIPQESRKKLSEFGKLFKYQSKENNLIITLQKAVEDLIAKNKIKKDRPEIPKNLLPRFGFPIEDRSFQGQLKKLIQDKLYDQFMTDEFRIQQFNAKYGRYDDCKIMKEYVKFNQARIEIIKIAKKLNDQMKTSGNDPLNKPIIDSFKNIYKKFKDASNYDHFYNCCVHPNIDPNISDIYDALSRIIEALTKQKDYNYLLRPIEKSKRIVLLAISVANKDPKSTEILKKLYEMIPKTNPTSGGGNPTNDLFSDPSVFYGQMIHLEKDYPEYNEKSLQRYLDILKGYADGNADIRKFLNIKTIDDLSKKIEEIEENLKKIKLMEDDKKKKKTEEDESKTNDTKCIEYYKEHLSRMNTERIMYMSDLTLLRYACTFDKSPKSKKLQAKIDGLIGGTKSASVKDASTINTMINRKTQLDNIASSILANINRRLNPMGDITKKILANINERLSKPADKPVVKPANVVKPVAKLAEVAKPNIQQVGPQNLNKNAPPQESVTPDYEAASGYDDDEGKEPDGVPVATSINPETGKAYTDYPETVYVGNYFAYEFHEKQDKMQYVKGPWLFKEMFTTPPAVYKEPEQIVRKLRLTSTESSGEFKMDGKYNIELCENESDKCEALMSANVPAQDTLETHYYTYFGKTRLIDGKKQTPEKTMEYDDGNTYANRMKEAMLELIQRKVSVEEPAVAVAESESKESSVVNKLSDAASNFASSVTETLAKKINSIVPIIPASLEQKLDTAKPTANTKASGPLEDKLKQKIKEALEKQLKGSVPGSGSGSGSSSGSLEDQLKQKIKEALEKLLKGSVPVSGSGSGSSSGSLEDQLKEKIKEALEKQLKGSGSGSLEDQLKEKIKAKLTETLTPP
jgi:hypothetical protein